MKTTVSFYDFRNAFYAVRPDNFSDEGLVALFEYLEQFEGETGEEMELDVIAICCDFSEDTIENTLNDYGFTSLDVLREYTDIIYVDGLEYSSFEEDDYDPKIDGNKRIIIRRF